MKLRGVLPDVAKALICIISRPCSQCSLQSIIIINHKSRGFHNESKKEGERKCGEASRA
jgi:hypothetical protein